MTICFCIFDQSASKPRLFDEHNEIWDLKHYVLNTFHGYKSGSIFPNLKNLSRILSRSFLTLIILSSSNHNPNWISHNAHLLMKMRNTYRTPYSLILLAGWELVEVDKPTRNEIIRRDTRENSRCQARVKAGRLELSWWYPIPTIQEDGSIRERTDWTVQGLGTSQRSCLSRDHLRPSIWSIFIWVKVLLDVTILD